MAEESGMTMENCFLQLFFSPPSFNFKAHVCSVELLTDV